MTLLLVQDDAGSVVGANAYIDQTDFEDYHDARGNDYGSPSGTDIENAIILATDYLDSRFRFVGQRVSLEQRTAWPRMDAIDFDDFVRIGIPTEVKEACADYAFIALTADLIPSPTPDPLGQVVVEKSSTVGPISESVRYGQTGAMFVLPKYPKADQKLRPLTVGSGQDLVRG